jgi:hypothetical protein
MDKKTLKYGQTPWDGLSREELLRELQRAYSAVVSTRSALRVLARGKTDGYWSKRGTGGHAIAKADRVVAIEAEYEGGGETIWRAFFRYADDLLFDGLGYDWDICPKCGTMLGRSQPNGERMTGKVCGEHFPAKNKCDGIMRPLTWDDMSPNDGVQPRRPTPLADTTGSEFRP